MNTLDLTADIIDVRNIIARVEKLEAEIDRLEGLDDDDEERGLLEGTGQELADLEAILSDLEGLGGDEKWRGHWYPLTLIRDSYFRTYAEELADDIGAIPKDAGWPLTCIDWEQAARELRYDYTGIDIDGATYWTR